MKKYIIASVLSILFLMISCSKEEEEQVSLSEDFVVSTDDKINYFIWKGLNLYYLWQEDVPTLADNRFSDLKELYTFFRRNSTPKATFNSLLNAPGTVDRFSRIVADYVALENSFQGINLSTGMEFGLVRYTDVNTNVFGYVRYVVPNSSAETSGIARGMYFNTVNGTQITDTNYNNLLFSDATSFSLGLADFNSGNPTANNTTVSLSKTEIQENPIAISKVIEDGSKKIGYLLYNQFASSYDQQLNTVFNTFKAEGIDDLIIDLRYNPGGSVRTSGYLGTMVTGQFAEEVYSKQVWNAKVTNALSAEDFINVFPTRITKTDGNNEVVVDEAINSLNLERVYFIVTGSSASASELIINALEAHIAVKVVGSATVGKQVGSITLYDSDDLQKSGANLNPNHTYAMQPLVFEIKNKNDVNYPNGIIPEVNFTGIELEENISDLGTLGERSDPMLDATLMYIATNKKRVSKESNFIKTDIIFSSKLATPAGNDMYLELK
jgi:carboxyl-terminal processing protease